MTNICAIMDIIIHTHNWIIAIHNQARTWKNMDIHNSITDIGTWIIDIHNYLKILKLFYRQ